PDIQPYLERNQKIAEALKALKTFKEIGGLDGQVIAKCLESLENLCPALISTEDPMDDTHYITENYRLLIALGHMTSVSAYNPSSDTSKLKESASDALNCLLPPFSHPELQASADLALSQLLTGSFSTTFNDASQYQLDQVVLYSLRNHLHKPEIAFQAYHAFCQLSDGYHDKKIDLAKVHTAQNTVALLNYQSILDIAQKALLSCKDSDTANPHEIALLESLLAQKTYQPEVMTFCCQSPAFVEAFKLAHPGKGYFTLPEHCVLKSIQGEHKNMCIGLPK
ncbi:unnamed protein product, partial [marine sediment metagenome]